MLLIVFDVLAKFLLLRMTILGYLWYILSLTFISIEVQELLYPFLWIYSLKILNVYPLRFTNCVQIYMVNHRKLLNLELKLFFVFCQFKMSFDVQRKPSINIMYFKDISLLT